MVPALLVLEFHEGMAAIELAAQLLGLGKGAGKRSEELAESAKNAKNDHDGSSLVIRRRLVPGVERNMMESEGFRQGIVRMYVMHPARGGLTRC